MRAARPATPACRALTTARKGGDRIEQFGAQAENDSKGCGGVMRVAPFGLLPAKWFDRDWVFDSAAAGRGIHARSPDRQARLRCAGRRSSTSICEGADLNAALDTAAARARPAARPRGDQYGARSRARAGSDGPRAGPVTVEQLGGGWVAEEALAIGVYAHWPTRSPSSSSTHWRWRSRTPVTATPPARSAATSSAPSTVRRHCRRSSCSPSRAAASSSNWPTTSPWSCTAIRPRDRLAASLPGWRARATESRSSALRSGDGADRGSQGPASGATGGPCSTGSCRSAYLRVSQAPFFFIVRVIDWSIWLISLTAVGGPEVRQDRRSTPWRASSPCSCWCCWRTPPAVPRKPLRRSSTSSPGARRR